MVRVDELGGGVSDHSVEVAVPDLRVALELGVGHRGEPGTGVRHDVAHAGYREAKGIVAEREGMDAGCVEIGNCGPSLPSGACTRGGKSVGERADAGSVGGLNRESVSPSRGVRAQGAGTRILWSMRMTFWRPLRSQAQALPMRSISGGPTVPVSRMAPPPSTEPWPTMSGRPPT